MSPQSQHLIREQLRLFHPMFGNATPEEMERRKARRARSRSPDPSTNLLTRSQTPKSPILPTASSAHSLARRSSPPTSAVSAWGLGSTGPQAQRTGAGDSGESNDDRARERKRRHARRRRRRRREKRRRQQARKPSVAEAPEPLPETPEQRHRRMLAEREEKKRLRAEKATYDHMAGPSRLAALLGHVACKYGDVYGARPVNLALEACVEAGDWRAALEICHGMRNADIATDGLSHALIVDVRIRVCVCSTGLWAHRQRALCCPPPPPPAHRTSCVMYRRVCACPQACKLAPEEKRDESMYSHLLAAGVPLMVCFAAAPAAVRTNSILESMFHTFAS